MLLYFVSSSVVFELKFVDTYSVPLASIVSDAGMFTGGKTDEKMAIGTDLPFT